MSDTEMIREAAALRQAFQLKRRLRLEFMASLSKLLREHEVPVDDELLVELILAVPDELLNGVPAGLTNGAAARGKIQPPQSSQGGGREIGPPQSVSKKAGKKSAKKKGKRNVGPPQ